MLDTSKKTFYVQYTQHNTETGRSVTYRTQVAIPPNSSPCEQEAAYKVECQKQIEIWKLDRFVDGPYSQYGVPEDFIFITAIPEETNLDP